MNKAESSYIALHLVQHGMEETDDPEQADNVIIHTCSVRQTAENRIWGRLGRYTALKKKRDFNLIVAGCMADRLGGEIQKKSPEVDYVLGNAEKMDIFSVLAREEERRPRTKPANGKRDYRFPLTYGYSGAFQAYVPILHGCDNFCTYCIVPRVRGRELSRSGEKILYECKVLEEAGVREITFLGQNVNSYRGTYKNGTLDFPALLRLILRESRRVPWFRFLTSHPKDFSNGLIECIAENPRLCREIHLPVQHGSDTVLAAMNRRYTRETYLALAGKIKQAIPDASLTTDILIGFPGETERDFLDTVDLLKAVQFDDAYTYKYNIREGTPAAGLPDQVPEDVKQNRLEEIIAIQRDISNNRRKCRVGDVTDVLVKQFSKRNSAELLGVAEFGASVVFSGTLHDIGAIVPVRLTSAAGSTLKGEKI